MQRAVRSPLAAFLRHRYRAHVQGWLLASVGAITVAYVGTLPNEPPWLAWPASFLSALFVVSLVVALSALLRLPWWLWMPLTLASMAVEWALRQLLHRPWRRRPQPRERWLSNPFAWWQRRRLSRLRRPRKTGRPAASVIPFPRAAVPKAQAREFTRAPCQPAWSADGLFTYVVEAFGDHWTLWMISAPLWILLWLWLIADQTFLVALFLTLILSFVGNLLLVIPLAAAVLALATTLLVGAGMTPLARQAAVARWQAQRAMPVHTAQAHTPPPPSQPIHWVWPLLLGLWIGQAWGKDE
ncbi:hypothetical protein [Tepidimonas aquatica]|uniref:Uncharacterized protein n=1 Tax=Tepidimonas aquatica TaxID=247482 RepID=A0A554WW66_9BURK|nr:hypothetical protein [Tepidimonas aquatica]TSE27812.1 hypothetical protein Taqua_00005 [Tepidimonas aquatica]